MLGEEGGRRQAGPKRRVPHEPAQEGQGGDDAFDLDRGERVAETVERLVARLAVGDQLRDHRVVAGADLVAFLDACVDADAVRQAQPLEPAGLWEEGARVLGVEPHLDRVAARMRWRLDRLPGCDPQLRLHEVDPADELGHRVLDLDAPVQLEEEELPAVEHELGGAGASVADGAPERDRGLLHAVAQLGVDRDRRRLLEHLLVAALD